MLLEAKNIVNTTVWGFRGTKYGPLLRELQNTRNIPYLTILGHYGTEKKAAGATAATTTPVAAAPTTTATTTTKTAATTTPAAIVKEKKE